MSSPLLLQQCPACLVGWFSRWVVGGRTAAVLWDAAFRICSIQPVAFLCNCRQAFFPYSWSRSIWCIRIVVLTPSQLGKNSILFYWIGLTNQSNPKSTYLRLLQFLFHVHKCVINLGRPFFMSFENVFQREEEILIIFKGKY